MTVRWVEPTFANDAERAAYQTHFQEQIMALARLLARAAAHDEMDHVNKLAAARPPQRTTW